MCVKYLRSLDALSATSNINELTSEDERACICTTLEANEDLISSITLPTSVTAYNWAASLAEKERENRK